MAERMCAVLHEWLMGDVRARVCGRLYVGVEVGA